MPQQQSLARFFSAPAKRAKIEVEGVAMAASTEAAKPTDADADAEAEAKAEAEADVEADVEADAEADASELSSPAVTKEEAAALIERMQHDTEVHKNASSSDAAADSATAPPSAVPAPLRYSRLTSLFETIEGTSSRLAITATVAEFYLEVLQTTRDPALLAKVVYLCINRLGPDYEPDLELGLGESLLIKAISECYGRPAARIKKEYQQCGDLGLVAQQSRLGQPTMFKPAALDVPTVFDNLTRIARATGRELQLRKTAIIGRMLTACDAKSADAKFLVRLLEGKLRIGLAEKTVLIALGQAFVLYELQAVTPERVAAAEEIIREAFLTTPNYQLLIEAAFAHGVFNLLQHCHLTPGIPLKPMLAKPTKLISEVLDRFQGEEFTCEYKYDGERAQIHYFDHTIKIYLRNSEDMSQRYPDLLGLISSVLLGASLAILDCEVVAWDPHHQRILPFQVLSTRKRKAVEEKDIKVNICLFVFDILLYNGAPLIARLLAQRRQVLFDHFAPVDGKFAFATYKNSTNLEELQLFLEQSVKDLCEGLMVKMLNGHELYYEPSKRLRNWLKLKKDYLAGVGDSLDLVVVGAYIGKGKRTGTYGGFLLATYNQDTGEYETTCKIGTGFSDEMLATLYDKLHPTELARAKPFYVYDTRNPSAVPDVWLEPTTVFEVLTADLSLSPVYKAAATEYGKGILLRFPRFLRIRDDKGIEDATSLEQISELYQRQASVAN